LPDVQAKILDYGFEPLGDKTEPFVEFVNAQTARWEEAVKAAGIEPPVTQKDGLGSAAV